MHSWLSVAALFAEIISLIADFFSLLVYCIGGGNFWRHVWFASILNPWWGEAVYMYQ